MNQNVELKIVEPEKVEREISKRISPKSSETSLDSDVEFECRVIKNHFVKNVCTPSKYNKKSLSELKHDEIVKNEYHKRVENNYNALIDALKTSNYDARKFNFMERDCVDSHLSGMMHHNDWMVAAAVGALPSMQHNGTDMWFLKSDATWEEAEAKRSSVDIRICWIDENGVIKHGSSKYDSAKTLRSKLSASYDIHTKNGLESKRQDVYYMLQDLETGRLIEIYKAKSEDIYNKISSLYSNYEQKKNLKIQLKWFIENGYAFSEDNTIKKDLDIMGWKNFEDSLYYRLPKVTRKDNLQEVLFHHWN